MSCGYGEPRPCGVCVTSRMSPEPSGHALPVFAHCGSATSAALACCGSSKGPLVVALLDRRLCSSAGSCGPCPAGALRFRRLLEASSSAPRCPCACSCLCGPGATRTSRRRWSRSFLQRRFVCRIAADHARANTSALARHRRPGKRPDGLAPQASSRGTAGRHAVAGVHIVPKRHRGLVFGRPAMATRVRFSCGSGPNRRRTSAIGGARETYRHARSRN